jgi:hypothetical protein
VLKQYTFGAWIGMTGCSMAGAARRWGRIARCADGSAPAAPMQNARAPRGVTDPVDVGNRRREVTPPCQVSPCQAQSRPLTRNVRPHGRQRAGAGIPAAIGHDVSGGMLPATRT